MSDEPIRRPCNAIERAILRRHGCTCDAPEVELTPVEPDDDEFPVVAMQIVPGLGIVQRAVHVDAAFVHANACPLLQRDASPWN